MEVKIKNSVLELLEGDITDLTPSRRVSMVPASEGLYPDDHPAQTPGLCRSFGID